jgi:NarL family two-component system response regulator YdfI
VIRTVVAASSAIARAGLAAVLRGDTRVNLIGEVSSEELARAVASLDPDVVVEQREHVGEGVRAPTVMLVEDPRFVWTSDASLSGNERGAHAILSHDASAGEILAAVIAVAAGLVAIQPRTLVAAGAFDGGAAREGIERLSRREVDVLAQLARGAGNKAIGGALGISEHTVKFHIASIFGKLGVSSRTEAVTQGVRLGLIML